MSVGSNSAVCLSAPSSLPILAAKSDISVGLYLKPLYFVLNDGSTFIDKQLPKSHNFTVNKEFDDNYFVSLYNMVASFNNYNFSGARVKLNHSKLNLSKFRDLLPSHYSDLGLLQYLEYGFPLGLVDNYKLQPSLNKTRGLRS